MKRFLIGMLTGIVLLPLIGAMSMPQMGRLFFVADQSRLSFEDTVAEVRKQCETNKNGWYVIQEKDYNAAYKKRNEGGLPFRLVEFKLGNPDHSYRVNKQFPAICTFMPAAIAVVEYEPGHVVVYRKNTGLMGRMFTGAVKDVMQTKVPVELDAILTGIIEE
jgi:uncharacterized protein (DUF302 family)